MNVMSKGDVMGLIDLVAARKPHMIIYAATNVAVTKLKPAENLKLSYEGLKDKDAIRRLKHPGTLVANIASIYRNNM